MNYEELLNQYLDGTLSEAGEETLFSAAASDVAFRREFNDALRLRSAVQHEASTVIPPAELTSSIFAGLGYATVPLTPWYTTLMQKYGSQAVSMLAGGVIAWLLFWQIGGQGQQSMTATKETSLAATNGGNSVIVRHDTVVKEVPSLAFATEQPATVEAQKTEARLQTLRAENRRLREEVRYLFSTMTIPQHNAQAENLGNNSQEHSSATVASSSDAALPLTAVALNSVSDIQPTATAFHGISSPSQPLSGTRVPAVDFINPVPDEGDRWELYFRSLRLTAADDYKVATNDNVGISNMVIGGLWKYTNNVSFGIEIGREAFSQRYRTVINDKPATVYQNPTLWWGGLCGRVEFNSFLGTDILYPFVQGGYGWASGQYLRGMGGFIFKPEQHIRMHIGGEMVGLWYNGGGQMSITTSKAGWVYGISYSF